MSGRERVQKVCACKRCALAQHVRLHNVCACTTRALAQCVACTTHVLAQRACPSTRAHVGPRVCVVVHGCAPVCLATHRWFTVLVNRCRLTFLLAHRAPLFGAWHLPSCNCAAHACCTCCVDSPHMNQERPSILFTGPWLRWAMCNKPCPVWFVLQPQGAHAIARPQRCGGGRWSGLRTDQLGGIKSVWCQLGGSGCVWFPASDTPFLAIKVLAQGVRCTLVVQALRQAPSFEVIRVIEGAVSS